MKYWLFQSNQVLGPYEPDDLSKIAAFSPESLVCSEGRRGTNMGDWQRAGMVPDLSVALLRANSSGGKTATLSTTGLPPEPTFKDIALRVIAEKVTMLEDVVRTLQASLRDKDADFSAIHGESEMLKRQLAGFEERLASVRLLGETLDRAVAEEKRVEHDVEKQGQTLSELAHAVENMRCRLEGSLPAPAAAPAAVAPVEVANTALPFLESPPPAPMPTTGVQTPVPEVASFPTLASEAASSPTAALVSAGFEPIQGPPSVPVTGVVGVTAAPAAASAKGKTALIVGVVLAVGTLAILAVVGGYVPGVLTPSATEVMSEPEPAPAPEPVSAPEPAPAPDPRALAVNVAKTWPLRGGRTLTEALETLAPPSGNLSPWMAETLAGGRVQVNYFARSAGAGAPTIAYEFEVDLEGKTLVGRNAAAKSVLTGKAVPPPAPPKTKPVRVKSKKAVAPIAKAPEDETLDVLLGESAAAATAQSTSARSATSAANSKTETVVRLPGWDGGEASVTEPGELVPESGVDVAKPHSRPSPTRRAAKAKAKGAEAAADESLLDDLLTE